MPINLYTIYPPRYYLLVTADNKNPRPTRYARVLLMPIPPSPRAVPINNNNTKEIPATPIFR